MLYIARILYPVRTLGPGLRIGLWLCGCSHGCKGCSNPELWERQEKYRVHCDKVMRLIRAVCGRVDGFTITGGDPMEQAEGLSALLPELRSISQDILIYTGYTYQELTAMHSEAVDNVLKNTAVLIDGRYIRERNNGCPLRGSDNQNIYYLDGNYRSLYEEYMKRGNEIQNFQIGSSVVSVGIHSADYPEQLERRLAGKNLTAAAENDDN